MKQDLEVLQHRLSNDFGLPTVPEFSAGNLLVLCHAYAFKLAELWEARQEKASPAFEEPRLQEQPSVLEFKSSWKPLKTFWSKSEDMECNVMGLEKEMTLDWQEIYEVLEEAFADAEEQRKGCELLETLDYRVSPKNITSQQLAPRFIYWLQQANRYKDAQMKSIYYRMLNLSFEDSKDDQTFPTFVSLVHSEIESIFEMRNSYIRTIEQLNSQITDLIAETTKKQIQNGGRGEPLQDISNYESTPFKTHHAEQKRYNLVEQRKSLERSVEDMLAELLALKSDNQDLRGRLFERDKQIKSMMVKQELKQSQFRTDTSTHKDRALLHSIERQFSKQLGFLVALTSDPSFRKSLAKIKCELDQDQDILSLLVTINQQLQSLLCGMQISQNLKQNCTYPLKTQMNAVIKALDRLVVSEGKQGQDIENIKRLFVQVRRLESSLGAQLKSELIAPKLMGSIARIQKCIGKADRKLQAVLQLEKGFLLQLLGQLVPTDRIYQSVSIKDDQQEVRKTLQEQILSLKAELEKQKKLTKEAHQKAADAQKSRDELAKTILDVSKRITQIEKQCNDVVRQKGDYLIEIRRLRQSLKQEKEKSHNTQQLAKQIQAKDNDIFKLSQHNKELQVELEQQRKHFNLQRSRLAQQIQVTGSKLEDIQKLAERKLTLHERRDQKQKGMSFFRKKAS